MNKFDFYNYNFHAMAGQLLNIPYFNISNLRIRPHFFFIMPLIADSTALLLLMTLSIADTAAFVLLMTPWIPDSTAFLLLLTPLIAGSTAVCCFTQSHADVYTCADYKIRSRVAAAATIAAAAAAVATGAGCGGRGRSAAAVTPPPRHGSG